MIDITLEGGEFDGKTMQIKEHIREIRIPFTNGFNLNDVGESERNFGFAIYVKRRDSVFRYRFDHIEEPSVKKWSVE